jgi:hypothetical protein
VSVFRIGRNGKWLARQPYRVSLGRPPLAMVWSGRRNSPFGSNKETARYQTVLQNFPDTTQLDTGTRRQCFDHYHPHSVIEALAADFT